MSAAPLKVLVVDDEPPIRKLLRMGLTHAGLSRSSRRRTARPRSSCSTQNPDLVILDLGLPDIQGLELLRTIRARNESVPIVVLSSRGDEAGKVQALDLGADDYVTKPFGMDELLARMRAAAAPPAAGARRAAGLPRRRSVGRSGAAHRQGRATRR